MSFVLKSAVVCLILLQCLSIEARSKQRRFPAFEGEWSNKHNGWKKSSHGSRTKENLNEESTWDANGQKSHGRSHNRNHESDNLDQEESSYNTEGKVHERGGRHAGTGEFQQIFRHKNSELKRVRFYKF